MPADVFIIAVPTPIDRQFLPDISYVVEAAKAIAPHLRAGNLLLLESTAPVGTTEKMCEVIAGLRPDLVMPGTGMATPDIHVAYCPERVLPGRILIELVENDRCIGGITPACAKRAQTFYASFVKGACITTTARTAEMVKLVENSYRDVNIAFANELSLIADSLEINVWDVIELANLHPRVNVLQPGPGVGGHCIAVDPWFLVASDPANARIIRTAREVNLNKTKKVIADCEVLGDTHPDALIACLGLAFKPNIDDFRESPAMEVALRLAQKFGTRVKLVEPYAKDLPSAFDSTGAAMMDTAEALSTCDILILLVDHADFQQIKPTEWQGKIVYNTRGIWRDGAFDL